MPVNIEGPAGVKMNLGNRLRARLECRPTAANVNGPVGAAMRAAIDDRGIRGCAMRNAIRSDRSVTGLALSVAISMNR